MKQYLITGGAGFIGSNFIHFLFKKYDGQIIIHNVDKLTYAGNPKNLEKIQDNKNYKFYQYDIVNIKILETVFKDNKIDYVVNFAAESHVDRSIISSRDFIATNVLGTQTLLELSAKYNVEKYLQISTDEVYGSLKAAGSFTEESPIKPNSPYAASKAGADFLVRSYFKTHKLPCIITRCSNNYGPYQYPEKLIPLMILNALSDKPLPVYGEGKNVRDWIYVEDHCKALDVVLEKGKTGEIYNIGGAAEKRNIDVVKTIVKHLHKDDSLIKFVEDRLGHDFRYSIDFSKIKNDFGWQPEVDFDEGLLKTVVWYKTEYKNKQSFK